VAWWEGELDREKLATNLAKQIDPSDMDGDHDRLIVGVLPKATAR